MRTLVYGHYKDGVLTLKRPDPKAEVERLVQKITLADTDDQLLGYARQIREIGR